uniref:L-selectin n=1 Tax=Erpetoichthys calabaricus TaxID=27687 RepID=A0A8C4S144_ERPCA
MVYCVHYTMLWFNVRPAYTVFLLSGLALLGCCEGWKYFYSEDTMDYDHARKWCTENYTDLVAIQNQEEIEYLNKVIPRMKVYYWIGLRKIDGIWTWVGTKKPLVKEAENWASREPNNQKLGEDCVEIYIKRNTDQGKWNDELCTIKKHALCYQADCNNSSCSGNGVCEEKINNYTCRCHEGFFGPICQYTSECNILHAPAYGSMNCFHPFKNFSYNSSCDFDCNKGFIRKGDGTVYCTESGKWSTLQPECQAVTCSILKTLDHGTMTCSHPFGNFTYTTNCTFECKEGFLLIGNDVTECTASGKWSLPVPTCQKFMTLSVIGGTTTTLVGSFVTLLLLMIYRKSKSLLNDFVVWLYS